MNLLVTQCNIQLITVIITHFIKISPRVNQHAVTKSRGGGTLAAWKKGWVVKPARTGGPILTPPSLCVSDGGGPHSWGAKQGQPDTDAALAKNTAHVQRRR